MICKIRNGIRSCIIKLKYILYSRIYGMHIDKTARISFGCKLDKTNPKGINIGGGTYIASGAIVFSHDFARGIHKDTYIGKNCFIGANAIIMCGITIGDECIIGAGAIVTKNIPNNCIVAGNPARIIKENIHTKRFGQIITSADN